MMTQPVASKPQCPPAHEFTPLEPQRPELRKTRMCKFFQVGTCAAGENCSYAHGEDEVSSRPDWNKTKLCGRFLQGRCRRENCKYAHGHHELRSKDRSSEGGQGHPGHPSSKKKPSLPKASRGRCDHKDQKQKILRDVSPVSDGSTACPSDKSGDCRGRLQDGQTCYRATPQGLNRPQTESPVCQTSGLPLTSWTSPTAYPAHSHMLESPVAPHAYGEMAYDNREGMDAFIVELARGFQIMTYASSLGQYTVQS